MKKTLPITAALLLGISACATERPVDSYNEDVEYFEDEDFEQTYGNLQGQGGHLAGDIGAMKGLDHDANVQGYDDGDYTTVEVIATDDRGAAMHWLEFYGGLDHPALAPGNKLTFVGGNYPEESGAIHVEAMACQGAETYAWDYDEAASQVSLETSETSDPDVLRVDYTTTVPNTENFGLGGEAISSGSFLVSR